MADLTNTQKGSLENQPVVSYFTLHYVVLVTNFLVFLFLNCNIKWGASLEWAVSNFIDPTLKLIHLNQSQMYYRGFPLDLNDMVLNEVGKSVTLNAHLSIWRQLVLFHIFPLFYLLLNYFFDPFFLA